jgi:hypothetical protein
MLCGVARRNVASAFAGLPGYRRPGTAVANSQIVRHHFRLARPRDLNHPSENNLPVFGNSFPSSYHGTFLGTGWYWPVSKLNGVLKCEVAGI